MKGLKGLRKWNSKEKKEGNAGDIFILKGVQFPLVQSKSHT